MRLARTATVEHRAGAIDIARDSRGRGLVQRVSSFPVVNVNAVPGYSSVFNAGLLYHAGAYHLFARGIRAGHRRNEGPGPRFLNYVSDILVFTSLDGVVYTFGYVLARAGEADVDCFEDPRVQRVVTNGVERIVMTYTNLPALASGEPHHIGAHYLEWDGTRFCMGAQPFALGPAGIPNKDAVIFNLNDGRVALIHRIHPDMHLAIFDDLEHLCSAGEDYWDDYLVNLDTHVILSPSSGALGIGAGAPPVVTAAGLLLFFHERRADGVYTMNVALLDPATGESRSRLPHAVLAPELDWERQGDVDNVVFVQGCHIVGDTVYLTYGAADRCVGAATTTVSGLLDALQVLPPRSHSNRWMHRPEDVATGRTSGHEFKERKNYGGPPRG